MSRDSTRGQALMTVVIFTLFISLGGLLGFSSIALNETKTSRTVLWGEKSYYISESALEDMNYRILQGKRYAASQTLTLDGFSSTTTVATVGQNKEVTTVGNVLNDIRTTKTVLKPSGGVSFFYGVQVGNGGVTMGNGATVNGNIFSDGSISGGTVTGDAIVAGASNQISNTTIGNTGHASRFVNTTIHGSSCPNSYCIVENLAPQDLPIPATTIQDWRDDGASGGICGPPICNSSGNLTITNNSSKTIGPIKIPGNLNLSNGSSLTISGTIWVVGNINLSNNCSIQLTPSYGAYSGVIIVDGTIDVSNNCTFAGSGTAGSYIMLLSAKNALTNDVIDVSNNSVGVIFYASNGRIHFNNNSGSKEATAYGIDLDNNATITYESGLANVDFSSGPSGGYQIDRWKETQ